MNFQIGTHYNVKVEKAVPAGAVVIAEDGTSHLVHVSRIANCFVRAAEDFVVVGQSYDALAVEGLAKPVELSFKHLDLKYIGTTKKVEKTEVDSVNKRNTVPEKSFEDYLNDYTPTKDDVCDKSGNGKSYNNRSGRKNHKKNYGNRHKDERWG